MNYYQRPYSSPYNTGNPNPPLMQMPSTQNGTKPATPSQSLIQALPTGIPGGPAMAPMPLPSGNQLSVGAEIAPQTTESILYTAGFLKTQIGKRVKVEFLIGTGMLVDREGTLLSVGASYIILREVETDDLLLCDIYSIKFVKFYY